MTVPGGAGEAATRFAFVLTDAAGVMVDSITTDVRLSLARLRRKTRSESAFTSQAPFGASPAFRAMTLPSATHFCIARSETPATDAASGTVSTPASAFVMSISGGAGGRAGSSSDVARGGPNSAWIQKAGESGDGGPGGVEIVSLLVWLVLQVGPAAGAAGPTRL